LLCNGSVLRSPSFPAKFINATVVIMLLPSAQLRPILPRQCSRLCAGALAVDGPRLGQTFGPAASVRGAGGAF